MLSWFTLVETIWLKILAKPLLRNVKSPLPIDVRRSKQLCLSSLLIRTLIFALIGAVHVSRRWLGHFAHYDSPRAMELNIGEETITCKWKCIISNVTNNNNELWKTVALTSYKLQKRTTFAVRFIHFKVCPSQPSFVIRVLLVPSFNLWSRYFYVSLNLVDFQKVLRRI